MASPPARLLSRSAALPAAGGARGFLWLLSAYVLTHVVLRLLISPVLTIDDARETVLGQTLAWGYQPRQPPLYNWLVWGAFQTVGVRLLSLALVKYAVLLAAYGFVYLSARRILADTRLATLATFSLLLILPIGWTPHEALTHSVAVLAACAATLYALLRLEATGSGPAYLALGATLGLGMLSKFTYAVFAAALLAAALTVDRFRSRLLRPSTLAALALAVALNLPYALWFVQHGYGLVRMYATEVRAGTEDGYVGGVVTGLYYIVRVTFYYVTPLWLVFLVLFPRVYAPRPASPGGSSAPGRLLERFFACVLGLLMAGAFLGGLAYLKFRWLIPAFFPIPLYAFWRLEQVGYHEVRRRRFAVVLLAAEVAIVGGILVAVGSGGRFGRPYYLNEPYDLLAGRLAAAGFAKGTIVAGPGPLAGNLRLRFPDARVISLEHPYYVPPESGSGQCLVVWERGVAAVPPGIQSLMAAALEADLGSGAPIRVVEAPYRFAPDRVRRVHYVLLPQGVGRCR